jgi:hypothetical protein
MVYYPVVDRGTGVTVGPSHEGSIPSVLVTGI